jgi:hypothetical protein
VTIAATRLDADLSTVPVYGVGTSTVVALPTSDLDPGADKCRVEINGLLTIRDYDPVMEQP